jgi:predicted O-methyltransferase YrrM
LKNALVFPKRLARGLLRFMDPAYTLQRQANREIPRLLGEACFAQLQTVPGTSSAREGKLLAYLAWKAPQQGCLVEIGAFKGKTTALLVEIANRRPDRPAVYSIDPHADFPSYANPSQIMNTWASYCETVQRFHLTERGLNVVRAFSHDAGRTWNRPISFLWIDGGHEFEDVVHDIDDFVPLVVPGGWIVFDDAKGGYFPGVERAIREKMLGNPSFCHRGAIKHFEIFQRKPSQV